MKAMELLFFIRSRKGGISIPVNLYPRGEKGRAMVDLRRRFGGRVKKVSYDRLLIYQSSPSEDGSAQARRVSLATALVNSLLLAAL